MDVRVCGLNVRSYAQNSWKAVPTAMAATWPSGSSFAVAAATPWSAHAASTVCTTATVTVAIRQVRAHQRASPRIAAALFPSSPF